LPTIEMRSRLLLESVPVLYFTGRAECGMRASGWGSTSLMRSRDGECKDS
jgi:hypothetical protein